MTPNSSVDITRCGSNQSLACRGDGSLHTVADGELREDILHMALHGVLAEVDTPGDLLVGVALTDQPEDLSLPLIERGTIGGRVCVFANSIHEAPGNRRRNDRLTTMDGADR